MTISQIFYTMILLPLVQIIEISYQLISKLFDNPGVGVIGVSFVVTILCLPLYIVAEHWQQVERDIQAKMKPGVDRIKRAFSGDEQYMILSTYYRQNHYHPIMALRSSFGLLIQIPFFMAAYSCLSKMPDLQGQSFLFIHDMGKPDAIFSIGNFQINILPIAMTVINIIAGAIYTKGFPVKEKIQIYGMAVLFLVILYDSPAGLVLYWTMNNVFSLVKNIFYKMKHPVKVLYYCMCAFVVFVAFYILFIYGGVASLSKRLCVAIPLLLLTLIPLFLKCVNWILDKPLKSLVENKKERLWLFISSAIGLTLLTGLLIPSNLISSSVQEFSNVGKITSPNGFLQSPFWQSLGIFILWSGCIYFLFGQKIQSLMAIIFSTFLICALVNVFAFAGNYGSMDLTLKFIGGINSQSLTFILINLFVVIIISILPFIICSIKKEKLLSSISFIACLVCTAITIFNSSKITKEYKSFMAVQNQISKDDSIVKRLHFTKTGKNVVVLMLDRVEAPYLNMIFDNEKQLESSFEGFTFYPNTISYNGHTLMAAAPLYGGYEYTPYNSNQRDSLTLKEKQNQAILTLPRILTEQSDFTASMFDTSWGNLSYIADMNFTNGYEKISGEVLNGRYTGNFKSENTLFNSDTLQKSVERNLFFVSLFREIPAILRNAIYFKGSWWSAEKVSDLDEFIDWYAPLYYMNEITDFNSETNSLMMITNEATHSTQDVSELDQFSEKLSYTSDTVYKVTYASLEAVAKWLDNLKANGVYDNTRIIIVSDHGVGTHVKGIYETATIDGFEKSHLNPLFMVKDFNAKGEIKISNDFMTNADTPYIAVKDIVKNPINPFTNKELSDGSKEKSEGILVTSDDIFMPHHSKSNYKFTLNPKKWYRVKNNIFEDKNWTREELK